MNLNSIITDHTLIINELERSIKLYNWDLILSFLPKGSFLVGGYIRDIILGRMNSVVDVDIVVPLNAIDIGQRISESFKGKFVLLDKEREVVRIILNHVSIDIAKQTSPTIEGDLKSRDFSINAIAFSFDKKCLIDPLNGIEHISLSLLKTDSKVNLLDDPLRILRCFRFVSELYFNIDSKLITFIKNYKGQLRLVAKERISYEVQRIVRGENALESIQLLKKFNVFDLEGLPEDSFFIDLKKINFEDFNQSEKQQFLPLFFLVQLLDEISLENLKFSRSEIVNTKLLRKWHSILSKKNIYQLSEVERFDLHKELESILPCFIFYLPEELHMDWLSRWRDKKDRLFHPSNLIKGDAIKKHLNVKDGPIMGKLLNYLSRELAYKRLDNFDEAIYKAKQWIKQNAPKCD